MDSSSTGKPHACALVILRKVFILTEMFLTYSFEPPPQKNIVSFNQSKKIEGKGGVCHTNIDISLTMFDCMVIGNNLVACQQKKKQL